MSKLHTLTTDLIADCMALIPQYLELLNNDVFNINIDSSRGIEFEFDLLDYGSHNLDWYDPFDGYGLWIISHCLRVIPEFQNPDPSYIKASNELNKKFPGIYAWGFGKHSTNTRRKMWKLAKKAAFDGYVDLRDYWKALVWDTKKGDVISAGTDRPTIYSPGVPSIASATLHGQGEFPPSTLEELCESYKNVMSK